MLALVVVLSISESPSPDLPSNLADLKDRERELRVRLSELRQRNVELNVDSAMGDLAEFEEVHRDLQAVESELDLVMNERARQRAIRLGRPIPKTKQSWVQRKETGKQDKRLPPLQNRRAIRMLGFASVGMFFAVVLVAVKVMAPSFKHKKDEDLPAAKRLFLEEN
jgi:hypothetical protein